jgi:hypothetical protein
MALDSGLGRAVTTNGDPAREDFGLLKYHIVAFTGRLTFKRKVLVASEDADCGYSLRRKLEAFTLFKGVAVSRIQGVTLPPFDVRRSDCGPKGKKRVPHIAAEFGYGSCTFVQYI